MHAARDPHGPHGLPLVSLRGVSFSYDAARPVLTDLDLEIRAGERVCVVGANGSGKSTLARLMNGLLVPDAGSVEVAGLTTADPANLAEVRRTCAMVFQNPDDQLVSHLVEQDVAFGPENLACEPAEIRARVDEALAAVGMSGFAQRETHTLSGGQKQRIALAGALAMRPRALVLDEAGSMLDPRGREALVRMCRDLNARGMATISVTHFMDEAARASRVVALADGRIAFDGYPADLFANDNLCAELGLRPPASVRLTHKLQREGGRPLDLALTPQQAADELARTLPYRAESFVSGPAGNDASCPVLTDGPDGTPDPAVALAPAVDAEAAVAPSPAEALCSLEHAWYSYDAKFAKRRTKELSRTKLDPASPADAEAVAAVLDPAAAGAADGTGATAATSATAPRRPTTGWGPRPDETWALKDVTVAVAPGECVGIAGHTGSGKSSLLTLLNGLRAPQVGSLAFAQEPVDDKKKRALLCRHVGLVMQSPETQLFCETVARDVAFGPENLRLPAAEVDRRVSDALTLVGLDPATFGPKNPFELSGGQMRRVALAGILAMEPELLVLDEPTVGLDPAARDAFIDLVASLRDAGRAIAIVSHDMGRLATLCTRIYVMDAGRVALHGAPPALFAHGRALRAIGLDAPAYVEVYESLLRLRPDLAGPRPASEADLALRIDATLTWPSACSDNANQREGGSPS